MKLSILTGGYIRTFIPDIAEALRYYRDIGYHTFDFSFDNPAELALLENSSMTGAKRVRAATKALGVTFAQSHATSLIPHDPESARRIKRIIEICSYLEIPSTVIHLYFGEGIAKEEMHRQNAEMLAEFFPLLDRYGVDLCVENLGYAQENTHLKTADDILDVIRAIDHPHIHACWDTGHGNLTNQNQYESVKKLGGHLRCVHIHDNQYPLFNKFGGTFDMHNFPLFGNINFDAFIQGLIDIGYRGAFSLETDIPNRRGHLDFVHDGEVTLNLKPLPFSVREMADKMVYAIGRYMLETYGLFED